MAAVFEIEQRSTTKSSAKSTKEVEVHSFVKSLLCQELKWLIKDFEAKALGHCREVIDVAFDKIARNEHDTRMCVAPTRTSNSRTRKRIIKSHVSMYALEASLDEAARLKRYPRSRRASVSSNSGSPQEAKMIGRKSQQDSSSPNITWRAEDRAESSERLKQLDKPKNPSGDATRTSSGVKDVMATGPFAAESSTNVSQQAKAHPREVMQSSAPSEQPMVIPNSVQEEKLEVEGNTASMQPQRLSDQYHSSKQVPKGRFADGEAKSSQDGLFCKQVLLPEQRSPSGRQDDLYGKNGLLDFDPISPVLRTKSKRCDSSPVAGVANLDTLQRNLNKHLTSHSQTTPEAPLGQPESPAAWAEPPSEQPSEGAGEFEPVSDDSEFEDDFDSVVQCPLLLKFLGIGPLTSRSRLAKLCSPYCFPIVCLLICLCIVYNAMAFLGVDYSNQRESIVIHILDILLSIGTLACHFALNPLQRDNNDLLGGRGSMLAVYANHMKFMSVWQRLSSWQEVFTIILGLGIVACRMAQDPLDGVCFAIVVGVFVGDILCLLHVTNGLILLVDGYCCNLVYDEHCDTTLDSLVKEWNRLQALLRRASSAMTPCMIVAQVTVVAGILTCGWLLFLGTIGNEIQMWVSCVCPVFGCMLLVAAHLLRAAQVTGRCSRVPAFINSHCEKNSFLRRQLVEYTHWSEAGFYVFEVKLTGGTVIKVAYVIAIGSLTTVTRVAVLLQRQSE